MAIIPPVEAFRLPNVLFFIRYLEICMKKKKAERPIYIYFTLFMIEYCVDIKEDKSAVKSAVKKKKKDQLYENTVWCNFY